VTRRVVASGIAIVVAYLGTLAITVVVRDAHVRPLYDGFAPPNSYSWVDPPAFFAAGNAKPAATSAVVTIGPAGSNAAGVGTPDGQFVIDIARGAIARHASDRQIKVEITPVDPKHLAPVPLGLRANGNAYRVAMTYEPSNAAVTAIAKPGTMLVELPEVGTRLFRSSSGRSWSTLPARAVSSTQLSLSAEFTGPAYYVGATSLPELAGPTGQSSHRALVLGIGVAILAVLLLLLAAFVVQRRRRVAPAPPPE
jgi:hypothetical protein